MVIRSAPSFPAQEERLIDAALRCVARWGLAKTTLDDIAREAGVSRATAYRTFPGGRDALLRAVVSAELDRFRAGLDDAMGEATSLEDALTAGVVAAGRYLLGHDALQFLLAHEPEAVLPHIAFRHMDDVLAALSAFAAPHLSAWLDDEAALRAVEWVARLVVSYALCPSDAVVLTDDASVRRLVRAFVLPGLLSAVPS